MNVLVLYDMIGIVKECCNDCYDEDYSDKVVRGGYFNSTNDDCGIRFREKDFPYSWNFDLGFRCVKDIELF